MSDDKLGDLDWLTWEWLVELAQSGSDNPEDTERRPQVTIPPQAVEAAAKAMYEQRPHATDPAHWETPWEDVPKTWRRGQLAAARAVLEAATPWLQATKNGGDQ